jgi:hypothetical protein
VGLAGPDDLHAALKGQPLRLAVRSWRLAGRARRGRQFDVEVLAIVLTNLLVGPRVVRDVYALGRRGPAALQGYGLKVRVALCAALTGHPAHRPRVGGERMIGGL